MMPLPVVLGDEWNSNHFGGDHGVIALLHFSVPIGQNPAKK